MVRSSGARFVLVVAIVSVVSMLAGCFIPVFDLDTSLAYRTAGRMTKVATIGPIASDHHRVSDDSDYYFVPSVRAFPDHGTLVIVDDLGAHVRYFAPDPADGVVREIGGDGFNRDGLLPAELDLFVSPLRNSTYDDAFFVAARRDDGTDIDLLIYRVDLGARQIAYPDPADQTQADLATLAPSGDVFIGVSLDIGDSTPTDDTISVLTTSSSLPDELYLDELMITDTTAGTLTPVRTVSVAPAEAPVAGYVDYDTDLDTYVLSGWTVVGNYGPAIMDVAGTVTELDGVERIDAILSDGRLYHRGETEDLIYTSAGELELTIPTGRLRFAWETDSAPRTMVYTIAYFDPTLDRELGNLFVDVYSIETSKLESLQ